MTRLRPDRTIASAFTLTAARAVAAALAISFALPTSASAQRRAQPRDTVPVLTSSPLPTGRVTYRTLTEVNLELEKIATAHPNLVRRFTLPHRTVLGQEVHALEITRDVAKEADASKAKPVFLMTGLHHSREWPTVELTMEFVYDILMNDGKDARISALLDKVRFLVVPVVNPDGYELSRTMLIENKRKNCRVLLVDGAEPTFAECANPLNRNAGVDLNRNYGAFWGGSGAGVSPGNSNYRGPAPYSEPAIRNMRDLMASNQVVVALSNHTPDAKVLRVPSAPEEPVPADVEVYDALAQALGRDMAWEAGPWTSIYYAASGTMEEQAYYTAGTLAFTFEHTPGQRSFHPAYSFVIDQYFGTGAYPGSNARAAFLRLYESAADRALHSVLNVSAPSGATLTLGKRFTLLTSPVMQADTSRGRLPAIEIPTELKSTLVVPSGSTQIEWHVNPSLRPSQKAQEHVDESWTLTCSLNGRSTSVDVRVERGARAVVDLSGCGK